MVVISGAAKGVPADLFLASVLIPVLWRRFVPSLTRPRYGFSASVRDNVSDGKRKVKCPHPTPGPGEDEKKGEQVNYSRGAGSR